MFLQSICDGERDENHPNLIRVNANKAYEMALKKYHGWLVQKIFKVSGLWGGRPLHCPPYPGKGSPVPPGGAGRPRLLLQPCLWLPVLPVGASASHGCKKRHNSRLTNYRVMAAGLTALLSPRAHTKHGGKKGLPQGDGFPTDSCSLCRVC